MKADKHPLPFEPHLPVSDMVSDKISVMKNYHLGDDVPEDVNKQDNERDNPKQGNCWYNKNRIYPTLHCTTKW